MKKPPIRLTKCLQESRLRFLLTFQPPSPHQKFNIFSTWTEPQK